MIEQANKLDLLKAQAGDAGVLESEVGLEWVSRLRRSEDMYQAHAGEWEELRQLYARPNRTITVAGMDIVTRVSLAWAIVNNLVTDWYYQNPDLYVQSFSRTGNDADRDRMLRDVFNSVHRDIDSETIVKRGLRANGYATCPAWWFSFQQEGKTYGTQKVDEMTGAPMMDEMTGEPMMEMDPSTGQPVTEYEATEQRIIATLVDPHDARYDPDGLSDTLEDSKWVGRLYDRTLQECWEDDTIPTESRMKLVAWYTPPNNTLGISGGGETDPAHLLVKCIEIWDRASKTIIHIPRNAAGYAQFDIGVYPWPEEFEDMRRFPCEVIRLNENPPDKDKSVGIYGIPELALIETQLLNINRLEDLFMESATNALNKYLTIDGILEDADIDKISSDENRALIKINLKKLKEMMGMQWDPSAFDLRRLVALLPQSEEQARAIKYAELIDQELRIIYQIVGQGPGDRGGVAESDSATEAANIRAGMDKRNAARVHEIGKIFVRATEIIAAMLKKRQSLPIAYQRSSSRATPQMWDTFYADDLRAQDIRLAFSVAAGSSRPRNRANIKAERSELFTRVAPLLQQPLTEEAVGAFIYTLEPYEESDELIQLLQGRLQSQQLAKELAMLDWQISQKVVEGADPAVAKKRQELIAQLEAAVLGPAGIQQVAEMTMKEQQAANGSEQPEIGPGQGSLPAGRSTGQRAAAEAAAGMTNIQ